MSSVCILALFLPSFHHSYPSGSAILRIVQPSTTFKQIASFEEKEREKIRTGLLSRAMMRRTIEIAVFLFLSVLSERYAFTPVFCSFRRVARLNDVELKAGENTDEAASQGKKLLVSEEVAARINADEQGESVDETTLSEESSNKPRSLLDCAVDTSSVVSRYKALSSVQQEKTAADPEPSFVSKDNAEEKQPEESSDENGSGNIGSSENRALYSPGGVAASSSNSPKMAPVSKTSAFAEQMSSGPSDIASIPPKIENSAKEPEDDKTAEESVESSASEEKEEDPHVSMASFPSSPKNLPKEKMPTVGSSPFQEGSTITPPFGSLDGESNKPAFTSPTNMLQNKTKIECGAKPTFGGSIPKFSSPTNVSQNKTSKIEGTAKPLFGGATPTFSSPINTSQNKTSEIEETVKPPFGGAIPTSSSPACMPQNKTTAKMGGGLTGSPFRVSSGNVTSIPSFGIPKNESPSKKSEAVGGSTQPEFGNASDDGIRSFTSPTNLSQNKSSTAVEKTTESPFGDNSKGSNIPSFASITKSSQTQPSKEDEAEEEAVKSPFGSFGGVGPPSFTSMTHSSQNKTSVPGASTESPFGASIGGIDPSFTGLTNSSKSKESKAGAAEEVTGPSEKFTPTGQTTAKSTFPGGLMINSPFANTGEGGVPSFTDARRKSPSKTQIPVDDDDDKVDENVQESSSAPSIPSLSPPKVASSGQAAGGYQFSSFLKKPTGDDPEKTTESSSVSFSPKERDTNDANTAIKEEENASASRDPPRKLDEGTIPPMGWKTTDSGTMSSALTFNYPPPNVSEKITGSENDALLPPGADTAFDFQSSLGDLSSVDIGNDNILPHRSISTLKKYNAALPTGLPLDVQTNEITNDFEVSQEIIDAYANFCSMWGKDYDPQRLPFFKDAFLKHASLGYRSELDAYADLSPEEAVYAKAESRRAAKALAEARAQERYEIELEKQRFAEQQRLDGIQAARRLIEDQKLAKMEQEARRQAQRDEQRLNRFSATTYVQQPNLLWDQRVDPGASHCVSYDAVMREKKQKLNGIEEAKLLKEAELRERQAIEQARRQAEEEAKFESIQAARRLIEGQKADKIEQEINRQPKRLEPGAYEFTSLEQGPSLLWDNAVASGGRRLSQNVEVGASFAHESYEATMRAKKQRLNAIEEARRLNEELKETREMVERSREMLKEQARLRGIQEAKRLNEEQNQKKLEAQGDTQMKKEARHRAQDAIRRSAEERALREGRVDGTRVRVGADSEALSEQGERMKALLQQAKAEGWDTSDVEFNGASANAPGSDSPFPQQPQGQPINQNANQLPNPIPDPTQPRGFNSNAMSSFQPNSPSINKSSASMSFQPQRGTDDAQSSVLYSPQPQDQTPPFGQPVPGNVSPPQNTFPPSMQSQTQESASATGAETANPLPQQAQAQPRDQNNGFQGFGESLTEQGERLQALIKAGKQKQSEGWDSSDDLDNLQEDV